MSHLNFLLFSFVSVFVCLGGEVSSRVMGRQAGWDRESAGARFSWELGGGITATRCLLIAPRPRQYVCGRDAPVPAPTPPPATAHPPPSPSPWEGDGRPRRWLRLASPRMPSAASIFSLPSLLPAAPASSLRASRALPRRAGAPPAPIPLPALPGPPPPLRVQCTHF